MKLLGDISGRYTIYIHHQRSEIDMVVERNQNVEEINPCVRKLKKIRKKDVTIQTNKIEILFLSECIFL